MKTLLHIDMDAFFAAVEQEDRPELKGRPVVVGSPPDKRGVVATCSYEARAFGIHSAMPSRTAYARCPQAVFLPPRMKRYRAVSKRIMLIFEKYTPLVEPLSLDEAFLDVTGSRHLFGDGPHIARRIKDDILQATGLTCSVGVASNMFLAKIASDMHKPDGLTVVPSAADAIADFLAPLPVRRMWGAGVKTQALLEARGLRTFRDLQTISPDDLEQIVGPRAAESFRRLAFGQDDRTVMPEEETKSISNEITFDEDESDLARVEAVLLDLADKVGGRLRRAGFYAATARIKLRRHTFATVTRQQRITPPACDDMTLRRIARELYRKEMARGLRVRLIGFGVSDLCHSPTLPNEQPTLFDLADLTLPNGAAPPAPSREKRERLSRAVDRLRNQFGGDSVRRGSSLSTSHGEREKDPGKI